MVNAQRLQRKFLATFRLLPALKLVWQSSPRWTIARVIVLTLQGILPLVSLYLLKLIIDQVSEAVSLPDKSLAFQQTLSLLLMAGGVMLLTSLFSALSELVNAAQSQKVTDYMQALLHEKSVEVDLSYYENAEYHDVLQRAQQEAPFRPNQILSRLVQLLQNSISLVGITGLLLSLYWGIAGVLFVAALPALWVRLKFANVLYRWRKQRTALDRQALYLGVMLTHEQYAKEIRLFKLGQLFQSRFKKLRRQIYRENVRLVSRRAIANFVADSFAKILTILIFIYIASETIQGNLRIGDLFLYQQALQKGEAALDNLLKSASGLYEDNLFLSHLYDFFNLQPTLGAIDPQHHFPRPIRQGIQFEDVSFQYDNTERRALSHINLSIQPGETIALVGENGSGKTTLVKLLCRLYEPSNGRITIDGINAQDIRVDDFRQEISVIFQDYAKYHFSARDNIWMGNVEQPPDSPDIEEAARRSGAHEPITSLPHGYDTILGKLFAHGEELSIGQWQKVALARAFLRNSQLIILDEPTSAMDPKAEYEVFQRFRELVKEQMAVIVSHRLSTVKMADRIYVMDHGHIIEQGSHEALMAAQGTYAQLFETQSQSYL